MVGTAAPVDEGAADAPEPAGVGVAVPLDDEGPPVLTVPLPVARGSDTEAVGVASVSEDNVRSIEEPMDTLRDVVLDATLEELEEAL